MEDRGRKRRRMVPVSRAVLLVLGLLVAAIQVRYPAGLREPGPGVAAVVERAESADPVQPISSLPLHGVATRALLVLVAPATPGPTPAVASGMDVLGLHFFWGTTLPPPSVS